MGKMGNQIGLGWDLAVKVWERTVVDLAEWWFWGLNWTYSLFFVAERSEALVQDSISHDTKDHFNPESILYADKQSCHLRSFSPSSLLQLSGPNPADLVSCYSCSTKIELRPNICGSDEAMHRMGSERRGPYATMGFNTTRVIHDWMQLATAMTSESDRAEVSDCGYARSHQRSPIL